MAASLLFALAAILSTLLLLSMMPTAGAAGQRPVTVDGNGSLSRSGLNGDGNGEDGGCLTIGQVQPELEGFDMTVDLGSGVVFRRSLAGSLNPGTVNTLSPNRAGCGRRRPGTRYFPCTTDPRTALAYSPKCDPYNRGNPCPNK